MTKILGLIFVARLYLTGSKEVHKATLLCVISCPNCFSFFFGGLENYLFNTLMVNFFY